MTTEIYFPMCSSIGSVNFLWKTIYAENKILQLNLQFKKQNLGQSCKTLVWCKKNGAAKKNISIQYILGVTLHLSYIPFFSWSF